jgi:hypothetical protein
MMAHAELRQRLIDEGLIGPGQMAAEAPAVAAGHWLISVLLGYAATLAGLFFIGGVAGLTGVLFYEWLGKGVLLVYGTAFLVMAYAALRVKASGAFAQSLFEPFGSALALAGVGLWIGFFATAAGHMRPPFRDVAVLLFGLLLGVFAVYPSRLLRILASLGAAATLPWMLVPDPSFVKQLRDLVGPLPTFLVAASLVAMAAFETRLPRAQRWLAPAITGVSLALLGLLIVYALPRVMLASSFGLPGAPERWQSLATHAAALALPLVFAAWVLGRRARLALPLALTAAGLAVALTPGPELIGVLLVALIAHHRRSSGMLITAALAGAAAVGVIYYGWSTTLLIKAASLALAGALLLALWGLARRHGESA